jgi:hypothetical protein
VRSSAKVVSIVALVAVAALALAAPGCADQGEGAVCNTDAALAGERGDCASGLVCTTNFNPTFKSPAEPGGPSEKIGRCCLPDEKRAQSKATVCQLTSVAPGANPSVPPEDGGQIDASTPDTSQPDASTPDASDDGG